ncbi:hypothetical protein P2H44_11365 [Albimonas sp. CAU 1670]|uniref:hypothetical protein n=1 Tax=Albimonas sp. CAU 1670 TaxID=3032599 RepID=UPI0023DBFB41|nr:hypothetical protein [Albimonas sp. CAU 1670]MDF2233150.1 hypothetical protein [Albimonas sp. CAU 1670]
MRIAIDHAETRAGLLFRRPLHEVRVTVHFTHEETQIIRQRDLGETVLLERWPADARAEDDPDWYALRVKHLVERKPDRFRCATPGDAKLYEAQLVDALHRLKAWLDVNAEPGGRKVIEI